MPFPLMHKKRGIGWNFHMDTVILVETHLHPNDMKRVILSTVILALPFLQACEEITGTSEKVYKDISGVVQKGPFLNGTNVSIYTLNDNMGQTGETFTTQISDNAGSFTINNIGLSSDFVEFVATGFYYNEVTDETSGSQLTLLGLADLSDHTTLNVNIITHLTKNRITTLMEEGRTFSRAKEQACEELLNIFNFESSDIRDAELLDISANSEDNAMLLAISLIVQGQKRDADLSEFMANMVQDFSVDGTLDNDALTSELINEAVFLDGEAIRQNLVNRYDGIGLDVDIPPFEKYLEEFIEKTDYVVTHHVTYPMFGSTAVNMLYPDSIYLTPEKDYNMTAILPGNTSVKIRLSGGEWYYQTHPNGPVNWAVSKYDRTTKSQEFTSIEDGVDCELTMRFSQPYEFWDSINPPSIVNDTVFVEYFENHSEIPTMTKTIRLDQDRSWPE